mmetsp:Transcript_26411/g.88012  ORF Transcript_26411/g.88012 Transcript_26411/m.88012 type:complete len:205 (+) Transcript_26411:183-797(+)
MLRISLTTGSISVIALIAASSSSASRPTNFSFEGAALEAVAKTPFTTKPWCCFREAAYPASTAVFSFGSVCSVSSSTQIKMSARCSHNIETQTFCTFLPLSSRGASLNLCPLRSFLRSACSSSFLISSCTDAPGCASACLFSTSALPIMSLFAMPMPLIRSKIEMSAMAASASSAAGTELSPHSARQALNLSLTQDSTSHCGIL